MWIPSTGNMKATPPFGGGKWKLVREYKKPWELYNIADDRTEMVDLSQSRSAKRDEMIEMWEQWATQNEVAFPERFNMYEFLRNKRNAEKQSKN